MEILLPIFSGERKLESVPLNWAQVRKMECSVELLFFSPLFFIEVVSEKSESLIIK